MKKKTILYFFPFVSMLILTVGCGNNDTVADDSTPTTTDIEDDVLAGCTAFCMEEDDNSMTRTSMRDHKYLKGGTFMWEIGDKIWVENGSKITSKRSNITKSQATARFYVPGNFPNSSYRVYYTGENSSNGTSVTIKSTQTQNEPNNARHFGASGDCGTATATRNGGRFKFNLDHKAAYLCLMPRIENAGLAANVYLTKIVVKSNNNIVGTYKLDYDGLTGEGSSNKITLEPRKVYHVPGPWDVQQKKQRDVIMRGFHMSSKKGDVTNSAYMVIAPGTHMLTVEYTIKDPATEVEATITKQLPAKNYQANKVYDVTANLTPEKIYYRDAKYYMWDAKKYYWDGYENVQPYLNGASNSNFPKEKTGGPRFARNYINHREVNSQNQAAANINAMAWFVWHGDPHWDSAMIWSMMNHLYKGGMWFKQHNKISGFNESSWSNGIDYRDRFEWWYGPGHEWYLPGLPQEKIWVENWDAWKKSPTQGRPSNTADYFFLPAMGYYYEGCLYLYRKEYYGAYWSGTTISRFDSTQPVEYGPTFCLHFDDKTVGIECDNRKNGYIMGFDFVR